RSKAHVAIARALPDRVGETVHVRPVRWRFARNAAPVQGQLPQRLELRQLDVERRSEPAVRCRIGIERLSAQETLLDVRERCLAASDGRLVALARGQLAPCVTNR